MPKKSIEIKKSWIGFFAVILAAIITGLFTLPKKNSGIDQKTLINVEKADNSPITNHVENQTININKKDSTDSILKIDKKVIVNDSSPNSVNIQGNDNQVIYQNAK